MVPKKDAGQTSDVVQSGGSPALRSLCIIVADDDRDAVLSLEMLLREEGHEVHAAYNAKQALDQVLRHDPDALLLDIALGKGSGYEVAQTIRARHGDTRPMIVGISGVYKKGSDRILADLNGFNHYLLKPYDPQVLLALLAPLRLPRRRAEDEVQGEPDHTYRVALARAAGFIGGPRELSHRLYVPMADLTQWLAGKGSPPINVFLRVVDILLEAEKKPRLELTSGEIVEFPKPPESTQ
jgi:CheY-like chemotaxis protein